MTADKTHMQGCMLPPFKFSKTPPEIKKMIDEYYGDDSVGINMVHEWLAR